MAEDSHILARSKKKFFPQFKESGKGQPINTFETRDAAHRDMAAARMVLDVWDPEWRNAKKDSEQNKKQYKRLIGMLSNWGRTRNAEPQFANEIEQMLASKGFNIQEAYEGMQIMFRVVFGDGSREIRNKREMQFPGTSKKQPGFELTPPGEMEPEAPEPEEERYIDPRQMRLPFGEDGEGFQVVVRVTTLSANSPKFRGIPVTIGDVTQKTNDRGFALFRNIQAGMHNISVPETIRVQGKDISFEGWHDNQKNPNGIFNIQRSEQIVAYYNPYSEQPRFPVKKPQMELPARPAQHLLGSAEKRLMMHSQPEGVTLNVNGTPYATPQEITVLPGTYTIRAPQTFQRQVTQRNRLNSPPQNYVFRHWENGDTNHNRTINITDHTTITAIYTNPGNVNPETEFRCPNDVMQLGIWLVRRMPETNFDGVWTAFRHLPEVDRWIGMERRAQVATPHGPFSFEYTEESLRACLFDVYRGEYAAERGGRVPGNQHNPNRLGRTFFSASREAFRKGIGYKIEHHGLLDTKSKTNKYTVINDPVLRTAINRGKRVLRQTAQRVYIDTLHNAEQRMNGARAAVTAERNNVNTRRAAVRALEHQIETLTNTLSTLTAIADIRRTQAEMDAKGRVLQARERELQAAETRLNDPEKGIIAEAQKLELEFDPKNFANTMHARLKPIIEQEKGKLGISLAKKRGGEYSRYGNSPFSQYDNSSELMVNDLGAELDREADWLADYYGRRIRRRIHTGAASLSVGLRNVSGGAQTLGESWTGLLHNMWNFVLGPWTLGTIFVLIQYFFVLTYIGYNLQLLYVQPAIAAGFVWILNFTESKRPFDWITHLASGAMIGYSAELFLVALGAQSWSFIGGFGLAYWLVWAFLVFIGVFQFYQYESAA